MMRFLTAKTRITFGMVCLLVSVLCAAQLMGLVPDREAAIRHGRGDLCEAIAVSSSDHISRGELRRLEFFLQSIVERSDDVLSAGVRRASGELIVAVGDHEALWPDGSTERSTDTHVHVPVRSGRVRDEGSWYSARTLWPASCLSNTRSPDSGWYRKAGLSLFPAGAAVFAGNRTEAAPFSDTNNFTVACS